MELLQELKEGQEELLAKQDEILSQQAELESKQDAEEASLASRFDAISGLLKGIKGSA